MKGLSQLFSVALLPPCAIILESKSNALGIKSLIFRVHLATRTSFENTDPQKIADGILLHKQGIRTIKNGNLSLLSKSLYAKTLSSILTSRSKNQVWFPWRSTFSSNFVEQIFLNNVRNSLPSFIAQRSSLNRETP